MVQHNPDDDATFYPAKLLMIYRDVNDGSMSAILHGCEWRDNNEKHKSTPLCSRWSLEFDANLQPKLQKIKIAQLVEVLFVVEHEKENKNGLGMNIPNQRSKIKNRECCLDVVQPRYVWAQTFLKLKRNKAQ